MKSARTPLIALTITLFGASIACSSSSNASQFSSSGDAGRTGDPGEGFGQNPNQPISNSESSSEGNSECIPNTKEMASYTPSWAPPEPLGQNVCSPDDLTNYFDACLNEPVDANKCKAFTAAHATCAACAVSQDTDTTWGAVIWRHQGKYYSVNVAGCLARESNDLSATGCGGSYYAALDCKQKSCDACWDSKVTTKDDFSNCEEQAAAMQPCSMYRQNWKGKCQDTQRPPLVQCIPDPLSSAKQAFIQVASIFCGAPAN